MKYQPRKKVGNNPITEAEKAEIVDTWIANDYCSMPELKRLTGFSTFLCKKATDHYLLNLKK